MQCAPSYNEWSKEQWHDGHRFERDIEADKSTSPTINGENSHLGFQKVKQSAGSRWPSSCSLILILISGPAPSSSSGCKEPKTYDYMDAIRHTLIWFYVHTHIAHIHTVHIQHIQLQCIRKLAKKHCWIYYQATKSRQNDQQTWNLQLSELPQM